MAQNNQSDKATKDKWHNNPANWVLGVFYFNKEDKRIFPPKRSKLGWTVNLANPVSVLAAVDYCIDHDHEQTVFS